MSEVPGFLFAFAVRRMPVSRKEWGVAMAAELAQIRNRSSAGGVRLAAPARRIFRPNPFRRTL